MTPTTRTQRRRLEKAGYAHFQGWLPVALVKRMEQQAEMHAEDLDRILAEPAKPRGRPRKSPV